MADEFGEARIIGMATGEIPDFIKSIFAPSGLLREERNRLIKSYLGVKTLANSSRTYKKYPVTFTRAISLALEELSSKAENVERGEAEEIPGAPVSYPYEEGGVFEDVIFGGVFKLRKKIRAVIESTGFRFPGLMVIGPEGWAGSDYISLSVYTRKEERSHVSGIFEVVDSYVYKKNPLKGKIINIYGEEEKIGSWDWKDIAVPKYFIQEVEENIIWPVRFHEKIKSANLRVPRGIMLEGERGMGKTLLSKIIANKVKGKSTFIKAKPGDVQRLGWDYIFDVAKILQPSVLYIEDIETLAPSKQKFGIVTSSLTDVLDYLDGMEERGNVIFLASTNVPEMVDFGLLDRPGRIDRRLVFDPKNKRDFGLEWKKEVFEIHLRGHRLASGLNPMHLALMIEDVPYTGAHIEELIHTATLEALRRNQIENKSPSEIKGKIILTLQDFDKAKKRVERIIKYEVGPEVS
jgi:hypothetical protein